ncbi:hypothetical protein RclHR1_00610016 [Rhizophagus clarus]|uniref:Kinase-like domain-containing protein n=1 Tax=Rhizophagus clarus TaxID=94130 RepID=A0A2Z6RRB8_9GLOM|nr:hypothetical protein RclHR1_00610016 [Rhizophagus clarus]GES75973.1 kinase-like domain-containing protein [Rhizophagus clarus]
MNNKILLINVPYPPELTVDEILSRRSTGKLGSKAPNQFFLYRLAYIKELRKIGENISMTKISPYISMSWSKEPSEVKKAYKKLSGLVENRLKEIRRNDTLVIIHELFLPSPTTDNDMDEFVENQIRQDDTLDIIRGNFPSSSSPQPTNIDVNGPIFFYSYLDYDQNHCNYDYYGYYFL